MAAEGFAPGKAILLGEHSVVYGHPALAVPLRRGVSVRAFRLDGGQRGGEPSGFAPIDSAPFEAVAARLCPGPFAIGVRGDLPQGVGLGSSAALSVAAVRALATLAGKKLTPEQTATLATEVEAHWHKQASGLDPATCALGRPIRFVRGSPPTVAPLSLRSPFTLVVAVGAARGHTAQMVSKLAERRQQQPARYQRLFEGMAALVEEAQRAVEKGDLAQLGELFDINQGYLNALGVSTPELEALCDRARQAGAYGAKLTGAGGGGAVIAVGPEPEKLIRAFTSAGAETFEVRVESP